MRACTRAHGHGLMHQFESWRYNVQPPRRGDEHPKPPEAAQPGKAKDEKDNRRGSARVGQ